MAEALAANAAAFISGCDDSEFRPFAYYDKHLDCIRVQLMDCSFKEERRNRIVTVLTANHMEQNNFAGFNIKGVRYLFEQMGLQAKGVYKLADLMNSLVQFFPDASIKHVQAAIRPILREEELSIDFA